MNHRNHTNIERSIWVTEYEGGYRDGRSKRIVGEFVGYYTMDTVEKLVNSYARDFYVDEVRHKKILCKMKTQDFYNQSEKETQYYE